jgi:acetyl-CoA carboxylase biotin carboxylase subunit
MFSKVLIANRGEIACRVIRACQELGVKTVAVYSDPDAGAKHMRLADEAVRLGGAAPAESYLNQEKIQAAARVTGAEAVHPGYGFLAENAQFAAAVAAAGLVWIGPPPGAIERMGLKVAARETARRAGVPVVPGFESRDASEAEFLAAGAALGYPVLVKASAGGGGKGMRLVSEPGKLAAAVAAAQREAEGAFGDATVYLEKAIVEPRHIEIQLLADTFGHCVHLGERECSIQRRHQKVIEETPSVAVSAARRQEMGACAVAIAQSVGYTGAGTVEFMLDAAGSYYFLEMNTRLQVEHPVTELAYGVDLVQWQLRIAAGEPLTLRQDELIPRGHSIECRICAEDAAAGFLPATGKIELLVEPSGPGVRLDSLLQPGWEVGAEYDPLLGKLIIWGSDREAAIRRMAFALNEMRVLGVVTNIPFLHAAITHPAFAAGVTDTGFIARNFPQWQIPTPELPVQLAAVLALALGRTAPLQATGLQAAGPASPWQTLGSWSNV